MRYQGPVIQTNDIVNLHVIKISNVNISNMPIFLVEKMWEAFAVQKLLFFQQNFSVFGYKAVKHLTSWPLNELFSNALNNWAQNYCWILLLLMNNWYNFRGSNSFFFSLYEQIFQEQTLIGRAALAIETTRRSLNLFPWVQMGIKWEGLPIHLNNTFTLFTVQNTYSYLYSL